MFKVYNCSPFQIAAYASISFTLSPGTDFPGLGVVDISSLSPPPVGNTISAGVNSINELLRGGIMRGNVYEFVGTGGTGKSNLCFQLAVSTMVGHDLSSPTPSSNLTYFEAIYPDSSIIASPIWRRSSWKVHFSLYHPKPGYRENRLHRKAFPIGQ